MKAKGQTSIELAIFGSMLIFMIGVIVKQALNYSYLQNQNLKAMRWAMAQSHRHSEGIVNIGGGRDGDASRNSASVIILEDRLTADAGKYGAIDRVPHLTMGSATHSRNLLMPVESGESYNTPVIDLFINYKHFPLTTARFKGWDFSNPPAGCSELKVAVPNHPYFASIGDWNENCDDCFDLDRDGVTDVPPAALGLSAAQATAYRQRFAWQWKVIGSHNMIDVATGKYTSIDIDCDLSEERIIEKNGISAWLQDQQDGDLDFTSNQDPPPGLQKDIMMITMTKDGVGGTHFRVEEGVHDGQQVRRTTQQKDSVDIIQRVLVLSNDTGRFCDWATNTPLATLPEGLANPVEACGNCFGSNMTLTCMERANPMGVPPQPYPVIFVRSRIKDRHGRRWTTDIGTDPYVYFEHVPLP